MKKQITIFTDLEGTLLSEETGKFTKEAYIKFLQEIQRIKKATQKEVNIHIVSPMFPRDMEKILKEMDGIRDIANREMAAPVAEVKYAACYNDENDFLNVKDRRIIPLPNSEGMTNRGTGLNVKYEYIKSWIEAEASKDNTYIYIGNGRNDVSAMEYVNKLKQGITMCPSNSRTEIKKIAKYVSTKNDINGVTECLTKYLNDINRELEENR